jgi:hypothetical protein
MDAIIAAAVRNDNKEAFHDIMVSIPVGTGRGQLLLHKASAFGWPRTLEFLLSQRVYDVNEQDSHGYTPLHVAVAGHNPDAVALLLHFGADSLVRDNEGNTPMTMLCSVDRMHVAWRAWGSGPDNSFYQAQSEETRRNDVLNARLLANTKVDYTTPNNHGWNAVALARSHRNPGVRGKIRDEFQALRNVATMMAVHNRLGEASDMRNIHAEVMRMVCAYNEKGHM